MTAGLAELTREDLAVMKQTVPRTDEELWAWIYVVTGIKIPRTCVCKNHCSPFDWIADAYFDRVKRQIVMGPRGGGKTIGAACLNYAELLHKEGVEVASVGAILKQAEKMYRYLKGYIRHDVEMGLCYPPTMAHTNFANGSRLEVITGKTKEAVNSPHPHRATIDEYELMDPGVLEEALMMPIQTAEQPYSIRLLSTRKFPMGNVQSMMNQAEDRGFKVYEFCALDCAERCTEQKRPSCEPCKKVIKRDQQNQPVSWYDVCRERLREADGFLSIDKLIEDFKGIRYEEFRTQIAPCDKPTRGDAVFTEWSDDLHGAEVIEYDPDFPVGTGWDFGLNDPTVCTVWQWDGYGEAWCIDVIASGELAATPEQKDWMVDQVAAEVLARPYGQAIRESRDHWGDPAGKQRRTYTGIDTLSAFKVLRRMGIRIKGKRKPSPARRIEAVRLKLRIDEKTEQPSLFVGRQCHLLREAFAFAQWRDGKETYEHDRHSHVLDAAGYFIDAKWPPKDHDY